MIKKVTKLKKLVLILVVIAFILALNDLKPGVKSTKPVKNGTTPIVLVELFKNAQTWIVATLNNNPVEKLRDFASENNCNLIIVDKAKSKSIGYLYAIKRQAKFIYDTENNEKFTRLRLSSHFSFKPQDHGLIYDCRIKTKIINHFAHFGQSSKWPQGYPSSHKQSRHIDSYVSSIRNQSFIQHGLISTTDSEFDTSSPSLQIPNGIIGLYDSKNTFFHVKAFWALYLPATVSNDREAEILRSYWSQRLLWMLNETVSFYGPNIFMNITINKNIHDDFDTNANTLLKVLHEWTCSRSKFFECVIDLSSLMAEEKFWNRQEVDLIKKWIQSLIMAGYKEPKIVEHHIMNADRCRFIRTQTPVKYTPRNMSKSKQDVFKDRLDSFSYLKTLCKKYDFDLKFVNDSFSRNSTKQNYSLLITFNHVANYKNMEIIYQIYGHFFQNVVFCGLQLTSIVAEHSRHFETFDSIVFVDFYTEYGYRHYLCMSKAVELGLNTEGYLLMSDDAFFKYWNLNHDPGKIWFSTKLECIYEFDLNATRNWHHWISSVRSLQDMWVYFKEVMGRSDSDEAELKITIKEYLAILDQNTRPPKNATKFLYFGSDVFYVPRAYFEKYRIMSYVFSEFSVHLESCVPTLLAGLAPNNQNEIIYGIYDWTFNPLDFDNSYKDIVHFFHPLKLSLLNESNQGQHFCEYFLTEKYSLKFFN
jgi:hypothetical protein